MRLYLYVCVTLSVCHITLALVQNVICFYDASSVDRQGIARFTVSNLDMALDFCTHLVYGYAGINGKSLQLTSLNAERDITRKHFYNITNLKDKYPHIKFLLSVGGDKDMENTDKYQKLLEAGPEQQKVFIESVLYLIRGFKFDGLDLAFQFPRNNSTNHHIVDEVEQTRQSERILFIKGMTASNIKLKIEHKVLFTKLVQDLKTALKPHDLMLSLTVLPNINSSMYFNATALAENLDFINLQTFDFITPVLNPDEATYTAALYPVHRRNIQHSVDFHVNYWISQNIPRSKLNVGIASYGRAWKMTLESNSDGFPPISATDGPAPAGYLSKTAGLLTWTEICSALSNSLNYHNTGPLISVVDPHMKYVTYAYRPADSQGYNGMWVSYDDPYIAAAKAAYVKRRQLGGVALFDISFDDFHGICNGDTFPMLRYIKYKFL